MLLVIGVLPVAVKVTGSAAVSATRAGNVTSAICGAPDAASVVASAPASAPPGVTVVSSVSSSLQATTAAAASERRRTGKEIGRRFMKAPRKGMPAP